jgi:aminoglycoside phosphotransferase
VSDSAGPHGEQAAHRAALDHTLVAGDADGVPASSPEYRFDVEHTVGLLAAELARVHAADVDTTVAPLGPDELVTAARRALAEGRLTAQQLRPAYRHVQPERLVEILAARRPPRPGRDSDAPVLTHGSPTLEALRCRDGAALGFAGWEHAAVADRYRDLAVAASSVATDLGPMLVPTFFERYGDALGDAGFGHPDPLRLDWYALAAELTL